MKVAFLGLGRMGAPMAAHVLAAGHELTVWNRTPGRARDLVARGAREAGAPADAVTGADVVVTMLFGPEAVREVLADVAAAAAPGTLVVESSTIGADLARELAAELSGRGLRFVDAPVVGSVAPATAGTLGVLVGGSEADVAGAMPLLTSWGDPAKVHHVGPAGAGAAMKLVVNLTLGVVIGAVGEGLRLGASLGLDREAVLDALALGPVGNTVNQKRDMIVADDFSRVGFSLDLLAKDLDLCVEAGDALPLTAAVRGLARSAVAAGRGGEDYAVLAALIAGS